MLAGAALLLFAVVARVEAQGAPPAAPPPVVNIPVEPMGFEPPSRFYMPFRVPSFTLDFVDANHIMLTFQAHRLMRREADAGPNDDDQEVRVLVLSLPDGKITAQTTWRLHDRGRYLWPLGNGYFLLRIRNTLYRVGPSLKPELWLEPEGELASLQLSPDSSMVIAQYINLAKSEDDEGDAGAGRPAGAPTLGADAPHLSDSLRAKRYTVLLVDTRNNQARRTPDLDHSIFIPALKNGYVFAEAGKAHNWNLFLHPFEAGANPQPMGTVVSSCQPLIDPLSEETFLVTECIPYSPDQQVEAFDIHGAKLWGQRWEARFIWRNFVASPDGRRFVYESTEVSHSMATLDPVDPDSIVGEPVGVFDTQTGKLNFVLAADPVMTAGQNFALSPDGNHLAILRKGAIEIYNLPPTTTAAQAKY